MEFEISADGELVAYHGTGGKVEIPEGVKFIARKGVFDKDCKITQLCLPSTLIGHKYDEHCSCPHVISKGASADSLSVHRCKKSRAKSLAKDSVLFDVLSLDLPYLQSYVVSKDNKLYQSVNGVLIFKERVIVAVPARTPLPVKMEQSYAQYMQQTKKLHPYDQPPVTIRLKGQSLEPGQISKLLSLQLFASKRANLLLFYGPEITSLSLDEQDIEALFSEHNAVLITPKWVVEGPSQLTYLALSGFCHKSELYSGEIKDHYMRLMVRHERELYELSISKQLVMVRRFFNEMWRKPFDYQHEKSYLDDSTLLTEAVLRGSRKDISLILKECKSFELRRRKNKDIIDDPRTLMFLACRYGGYEKIMALRKSMLVYTGYSDEINDFDRDSCAFIKRNDFDSKRKKYTYRSPNKRECLNFLSSFEPMSNISSYLYTDKTGEVRSYKPIAVEERFRCICYFLKSTLYDYEYKPWKCFFSYLLDMSERKQKELAKDAVFYYFISSQDSLYANKLSNALMIQALKDKPHNVVAFAKLLQQQNQLLPIHKSAVLGPLVDQKDIVLELMPLCKLEGECLTGFIKMLIEHGRADTMSALLKTGIVEQHMPLSELRTLFEDSNSPELHAVLLDYLHIKTSSGHSLRADLTL
ncbi:hypothetical protein [Anaerobiospirillum succiniciproducens]|uniref:hypothetical protein n=1 Tax=Anaerobiospirillum succiniciproducens TaxID=13335 RepID=UPI0004001BA6|nr:hypothetical protein [Anaerobiospirillum succiniciproducens]